MFMSISFGDSWLSSFHILQIIPHADAILTSVNYYSAMLTNKIQFELLVKSPKDNYF